MNKQVKIKIKDKDYYCDSEIAKCIMRLNSKIELLEYNIHNALVYINGILIPYGDEWYWDDSSIRNYVVELEKILEGENNE